jgi:hypothetical protein
MTLATSVGVAPALARTAEGEGSSAKEKTVAVRLTPSVAFGPVDVRALVQVEPHPENRLLRITIDSAEYYRSTDIQLDGTDAAKSHFVTWPAVPPGSYVFMAIVYGSTGTRDQVVRRGYEIYAPGAP